MLPGMEPMPPMTTITYDFTAGKMPTSGDGLITGASSAPASAASTPEAMKTMLLARAVSMPAIEAPSRFCATACTWRPHSERFRNSASATSSTIATIAVISFWPLIMNGPIDMRVTSDSEGPRIGYGPTILSTRLISSSDSPKVTPTAYPSFISPPEP